MLGAGCWSASQGDTTSIDTSSDCPPACARMRCRPGTSGRRAPAIGAPSTHQRTCPIPPCRWNGARSRHSVGRLPARTVHVAGRRRGNAKRRAPGVGGRGAARGVLTSSSANLCVADQSAYRAGSVTPPSRCQSHRCGSSTPGRNHSGDPGQCGPARRPERRQTVTGRAPTRSGVGRTPGGGVVVRQGVSPGAGAVRRR